MIDCRLFDMRQHADEDMRDVFAMAGYNPPVDDEEDIHVRLLYPTTN